MAAPATARLAPTKNAARTRGSRILPTMSAVPGAVETKPNPAGPMKVQSTIVRIAAKVRAMIMEIVLVKAGYRSMGLLGLWVGLGGGMKVIVF